MIYEGWQVEYVLATAVCDDLYVMYQSGECRRYQLSAQDDGVYAIRRITEQPLPGGGRPLAIAGAKDEIAIYALVEQEAGESNLEKPRAGSHSGSYG